MLIFGATRYAIHHIHQMILYCKATRTVSARLSVSLIPVQRRDLAAQLEPQHDAVGRNQNQTEELQLRLLT